MMTSPYLEISIEFAVILLAPLVFQYSLWRSKEGRQSRMYKQNFVIFGVLYAAIASVALMHYLGLFKAR
jgi:hypothetical protein